MRQRAGIKRTASLAALSLCTALATWSARRWLGRTAHGDAHARDDGDRALGRKLAPTEQSQGDPSARGKPGGVWRNRSARPRRRRLQEQLG
jgi:hypothetical protein